MDRYFENLRSLGVKIDRESDKLEKIWSKVPLCGFLNANCIDNDHGSSQLINLVESIKKIQEQSTEDAKTRNKNIKQAEKFLTETKAYYETLEQQCQEIENLLSGNGYDPLFNSSEQKLEETSILNAEQLDDSITASLNNMNSL